MSDGKTINGKGRLTNNRIDIFQNIYGHAIRKNKGDPQAMSKAVSASLKHYCSTIDIPQHDDCPPGGDSWCSFQRDKATESTSHQPIQNPIAPAIQKIIEPVFSKFGNERFLEGCKNLASSNANESFHHVLWNLAPKEQYNSSLEIELAMNLSTCLFNSGFLWTYKNFLNQIGLNITDISQQLFRKIDEVRIKHSEYKLLSSTKEKRKKTRRLKNKLADSFKRVEGVQYKSASFHIGEKESTRKRRK